MNPTEAKARVKANVWKAIAKSGMDLSELPEQKLEDLIDMVTEASLLEMDAEMGRADAEMAVEEDSAETNEGEVTLWEGRPFMSLTRHYRITSERIRITEGLASKLRIDIELVKIQDISQSQKVGERLLNLGDISVTSHDPANPQITLENISNVQEVHEILRRAMLEARNNVNFSYREQM